MAEGSGISLENPLFRLYAFYSSLLVLKMLLMSNLTTLTRVRTKSYISSEDAPWFGGKVNKDEQVERVRRAHLNDLENIPIFFVVSLIYILTNPSYFLASTLFKIFTIARFAHSLVYAVVVIRQPARVTAFFAAYFVTLYMAIQNIFYFLV